MAPIVRLERSVKSRGTLSGSSLGISSGATTPISLRNRNSVSLGVLTVSIPSLDFLDFFATETCEGATDELERTRGRTFRRRDFLITLMVAQNLQSSSDFGDAGLNVDFNFVQRYGMLGVRPSFIFRDEQPFCLRSTGNTLGVEEHSVIRDLQGVVNRDVAPSDFRERANVETFEIRYVELAVDEAHGIHRTAVVSPLGDDGNFTSDELEHVIRERLVELVESELPLEMHPVAGEKVVVRFRPYRPSLWNFKLSMVPEQVDVPKA